jgi:UDP-N-acetylglucosamine--N-acetylmuramyl-(pentapeptide) pyrophosphoryl-undecaprenol N-acetylglucosamine transferase
VTTWAVISGGGTVGHTGPAIAIGQALVDMGHPADTIHFVGGRRGNEGRLVPQAGFPITLLPGRGIVRRVSVQNIGATLGLAAAVVRAFVLLLLHRPRVLVAVGGYASVPCVLAAVTLRIPIVVAEQNAVPGAANRLSARFAKAAAVSLDGTPLPRAVVTGNPVRAEFLDLDRSDAGRVAARQRLGIESGRSMILAFGGSLGALRINEAVLGLVEHWAERSDIAIRHAIGARDWPAFESRLPALPPGGLQYQPLRYDDQMPLASAAADLLVGRAGSSTIFEAAAAGLPSILIPSPNVTADHQTANAKAFTSAGAAVLIPDAELNPERLEREIDALLHDRGRLETMGKAALGLARPDAAHRIAELAEAYSRG